MTERDFEIGSKKFKLGRIDALKQFHIVRKLAPVLSDLIPIAHKMHKAGKANGAPITDEDIEQFAPLIGSFSKLSDQDTDAVLFGLLSSVEVQSGGGWARVSNGTTLMFQDMELPELMQIAGRAFMFNMTGFFAVLPQVSPGGG